METLWHDVRFATRQFRSAPGLTAVIVFTIALGIAANTTVFAVINTLFLNPLPVGRPHELVTVRTTVEGTPPGEALAIPVSISRTSEPGTWCSRTSLATRRRWFSRSPAAIRRSVSRCSFDTVAGHLHSVRR